MSKTTTATEWKPITPDDPPQGVSVLTKIDDERGPRNESVLFRQGRLWFVRDGSVYVYYTPTHYVPGDPDMFRPTP